MKVERIWEIDLLRMLAVLLMVTYHIVFDLNEFFNFNINYEDFTWFLVGTSSALLFIFISGLSSGFSKDPIKRGIKVFFFGIIITIATYIFDKDMYIRFGILHFIGVSMIISPFFRRFKSITLFLFAIAIIIAGIFIKNVEINFPYLLPIGITYSDFSSYDYYPLIPYFSVYLLGMLAYKKYYTNKRSIFNFKIRLRVIEWVSKNSLGIYILHQPIILGILYIYKYLH